MKLRLLALYTVLSFSFVKGQDDTDCVFNWESITEEYITEIPDVKSYKWSDETKVATLLMNSGEYVYVKRWACVGYGIDVLKIVIIPLMDERGSDYWISEMLEFGKQFLNKVDFEKYEEAIKSNDWIPEYDIRSNSRYEINIPHNNYPIFEASIERTGKVVILNFNYYMN